MAGGRRGTRGKAGQAAGDEAGAVQAGAGAGTGAGEAGGAALPIRPRRIAGESKPQRQHRRKDGWTAAQERDFLEALAATCNVSESAKIAGKSTSSVYYHKHHDAAFARGWEEALSIGYAELETMLLRELLFGSEQEEIMLDADGAVKGRKVKRTRNLGVALRLLLHHAQTVARLRAERGEATPDSPDALARMNRLLAAVRQRRARRGE